MIRSKENVKKHGEVFTPTWIVLKMLELIPVIADPEYIFLEPTCGNGQFMVELLRERVKAGISVENALKTMIGMDISDFNITECRQRLLELAVELGGDIDACEAITTKNVIVVDDSLRVIRDYGNKKGELWDLLN